MKQMMVVGLVGIIASCAKSGMTPAARVAYIAQAQPAVQALQQSQFDVAETQAKEVLGKDPGNPHAALVAGLTRYKRAIHDLTTDLIGIGGALMATGNVNQRYLLFALERTDSELAQVDHDLATAIADPEVALELTPAAWRVDWNRDGEMDRRDAQILQIEQDADGNTIPEEDPRRIPTYRYDLGDIYWGRAMVAFQRSSLKLLSAFEPPANVRQALEALSHDDEQGSAFVIKLRDRGALLAARDFLLAGLDQADLCRRAYLAETDDDREWVPNPTQQNHPMPLPVDIALYQTWESIITELRKLLQGSEGLSVSEMAQLGDHTWEDPPQGFINIGRLFTHPGDIVLKASSLKAVDRTGRSRQTMETLLADIFGDKYVPQMPASSLLKQMTRMRTEVERGQESFERKLRYLFWLN